MQPLPETGVFTYLWNWMLELGLGEAISWTEIKSWSDITGIKPTRDESTMMIRLSKVWINERIRGSQKGETAPEEYYQWLQSQN